MIRKAIAALGLFLFLAGTALAGNVKGLVLADGKPLRDVWVTDGEVFSRTDARGRYEFDSSKKTGMVWIVPPSGFVPESRDGLRPGFWQYLHLPENQDEMHDFLLRSEDQSRYSVILPTDFHLNNDPRKKDLAQFSALVTPLARRIAASAAGPVYTFHLGDFTQDIFWYEFGFNEAEGVRFLQDQRWPTLFTNVMGNHDHDGAVGGVDDVDWKSGWLYRDCFGPDRWSWDIGEEHWVFLDNIVYKNERKEGMILGPLCWGSRNYEHNLTDEQMAWLAEDLSHVGKDVRVILCMHCPVFLHDWLGSGKVVPTMDGRTARLEELASGFTHGFTVFSGHLHTFDFAAMDEYPHLRQYTLPATSGDQWKSPRGMAKAEGDGSPAGMMVADFSAGKEPEMHFETLTGTFYPYRVYDLNVVGKAYAESAGIKALKEGRPERIDYSQPKWKNCVLVNYWYCRPGDRVEVLEAGKPLPLLTRRAEDPVVVFQKDVPHIFSDQAYPNPKEGYYVKFHNIQPRAGIRFGYVFKSSSARAPLLLRITDASGKVRYEQELNRPLVFDPTLKQ